MPAAPDPRSLGLRPAARLAPITAESALCAIALLEPTSLNCDEAPAPITKQCRRALEHCVAALCVRPAHLPKPRGMPQGSAVRLATVADFLTRGEEIADVADQVASAWIRREPLRLGASASLADLLQACEQGCGA